MTGNELDLRLTVEAVGTGRQQFARVRCTECGTELAVGIHVATLVELAGRNATARPCCPAWRPLLDLDSMLNALLPTDDD